MGAFILRAKDIFILLLTPALALFAVACHSSHLTPLSNIIPGTEMTGRTGTAYFSGLWMGVPGTYALDTDFLSVVQFSPFVAQAMRSSGTSDAMFLLDGKQQLWSMRLFDGQLTKLATPSQVNFAPNGRKYLYQTSGDSSLYEGHVGATGARLFADNASFPAYSHTMDYVAYLNTGGLMIVNSDNSAQVQVDLTSVMRPGETVVLPAVGDYFPQWQSGQNVVAASLLFAGGAGAQRGVGVVVDAHDNVVFSLPNAPTDMVWSPDGWELFYISQDVLYFWDFHKNENVIVSDGRVQAHQACVDDASKYAMYVQTDYLGNSTGAGFTIASREACPLFPAGANEAYSVAWPQAPFCKGGANHAPTLTAVDVLIDGAVQNNPTIAPGVNAVFRVLAEDVDCNLAHGVALFDQGDGVLRPLSLNMPAGAGCHGQSADMPPPSLSNGAYNLKVLVEDICGAQSQPVFVAVTYSGMSDDDDDTAPDDDDNDNDNDDNDSAAK